MKASSITRAATLVAGGMILGRFSGLFREASLASILGLSHDADLAILAISIPDLLTALIVGGAAGAALTPEIHRLSEKEGEGGANQFLYQSLIAAAVLSMLVTVLLVLFGPWLVQVLAPGFTEDQLKPAALTIRIVLIAFPMCALTSITSAALQARQNLLLPAIGTLIFNGVVILGVLTLLTPGRVNILAWTVVIAAIARLMSQLIACHGAGLFNGALTGASRFSRLNISLGSRYLQSFTAIGLIVILPVITRAFASQIEGGISGFHYAFKLVDLPRGLLGAILGMVLFPRLSRLISKGNLAESENLIRGAVSFVLLATMTGVVCFYGCAAPIVSLLFERGEFDSAAAAQTATLAQIGFAALPALVLSILAMGVFHAKQNTRLPFYISLFITLLHFTLSWFVVGRWGAWGLMASLVIASWLHCTLLAGGLAVSYRFSLIGFTQLHRFLLLALIVAISLLANWFAMQTMLDPYWRIAAAAAIGALCFSAGLFALNQQSCSPPKETAS